MKSSLLAWLGFFDRAIAAILKWICIVLFIAITIILTLNIVVRFAPFMSMHWFDEILELLYGALIFYGSAALWVVHGHFSVGDWISKHIDSIPGRMVYRFLVESMSLVFMAVFFWYSLELFLHTEEQTTAFALSKKWLYACMPITSAIMVIYSIKNMYFELARIVSPELAEEACGEIQKH